MGEPPGGRSRSDAGVDDPVRGALRTLGASMPLPFRWLLGVVGLLAAVVGVGAAFQQALGYDTLFAMLAAVPWSGWFGLVGVLLVVAVAIIVMQARSPTSPPGVPPPIGDRAASQPVADRVRAAGAGVAAHLPAEPLIGRDRELAAVRALIAKHRVVTVCGTGGVGKTRLCEQVLVEAERSFPGGALWVDLYEAHSVSDIANRLAAELGVLLPDLDRGADTEADVAAVGAMLAARPDTLVVLDNVEHLVEFAPVTIGVWRSRTPRTRFLVTSREPLGLGEQEFPLEPFTTSRNGPPTGDGSASVELFTHTACKGDPGFEVDDGNREAVAGICDAVGGLPWAIEVAAANVAEGWTPASVLAHIGAGLSSRRRDVDRRQRNEAELVDWSLRFLGPDEVRDVLRMSLLPGSFDADTVAAVVGARDGAAVRGNVSMLRRKRIVHTTRSIRGTDRFAMYPIVRERCLRLLSHGESAPEVDRLEDVVADRYISFVTAWDERIDTQDIAEALDRLEADYENVMVISRRCLERGDGVRASRLYVGLTGMLRNRRIAEDRHSHLERCLAALENRDPLTRARVLLELGVASSDLGDIDGCQRECGRALGALAGHHELGEAARVRGEAYLERARALGGGGNRQESDERLRDALSDLDDARDALRSTEPRLQARIARWRAELLAALRDDGFRDAEHELQVGESWLAGIPAPRTRLLFLFTRLDLLEAQGRYREALDLLPEATRTAEKFSASYFDTFLQMRRARLLVSLGAVASAGERAGENVYDEAASIFSDLAAQARARGNEVVLIGHLIGLAEALTQGDDQLRLRRHASRAVSALEEAGDIARRLDSTVDLAITLGNRGRLHLQTGDAAAAEPLATECLALLEPYGDRAEPNLFISTAILAEARAALGRPGWQDEVAAALGLGERLPEHMRTQNAEVAAHLDALRGVSGSASSDTG